MRFWRTPSTPDPADDQGARRALARRRRRRRIRLAALWTACAAILAVGGSALVLGGNVGVTLLRTHTGLSRVRAIDPGATRWVPPWEIVDSVGVEPGDDLLAVNPEEIARRVSRHPRIASARVTRGWNRTLRIDVVELPPVALWMGNQLLEVAADGTVLGPPPEGVRDWPVASAGSDSRGLGLPLLTGVSGPDVGVGERLHGEGARQALAFLARLRAYELDGDSWISEIWAQEPGNLLAVTLEGGIPVRLGDGRLGPRKVKALRTVLSRVAGEEDPVAFVDARFRHQVIVKTS